MSKGFSRPAISSLCSSLCFSGALCLWCARLPSAPAGTRHKLLPTEIKKRCHKLPWSHSFHQITVNVWFFWLRAIPKPQLVPTQACAWWGQLGPAGPKWASRLFSDAFDLGFLGGSWNYPMVWDERDPLCLLSCTSRQIFFNLPFLRNVLIGSLISQGITRQEWGNEEKEAEGEMKNTSAFLSGFHNYSFVAVISIAKTIL